MGGKHHGRGTNQYYICMCYLFVNCQGQKMGKMAQNHKICTLKDIKNAKNENYFLHPEHLIFFNR